MWVGARRNDEGNEAAGQKPSTVCVVRLSVYLCCNRRDGHPPGWPPEAKHPARASMEWPAEAKI